jgi:hypothetical protein
MEANALYQSAKKRVGNALSGIKARPKNALIDATRGALMGVTTDILGYPVDVASMAMQPFGYSAEKPVGGSDWLAEKLTSPTGSAAETAGRFASGFLAPGPDDMMRMAGLMKPKAPVNELITYHGSPHRINNVDEANPMGKFDLSKVGTGEGNQAYGHGIYLAETPGVARGYARDLANDDPNTVAGWALGLVAGDKEAAVKALRSGKAVGGINMPQHIFNEAADLLDNGKARDTGYLYTVDLPDEHIAKMLDWDKPLSEQPAHVQQYISQFPGVEEARKSASQMKFEEMELIAMNDSKLAPLWRRDEAFGPNLIDASHRVAWGKGTPADARMVNKYFKEYAPVYEAKDFTSGLEASKGLSVGTALEKADIARGNGPAISKTLREFGYPGIKYLDGNSRADGEGTRNFVIFDGDTAKILKRE